MLSLIRQEVSVSIFMLKIFYCLPVPGSSVMEQANQWLKGNRGYRAMKLESFIKKLPEKVDQPDLEDVLHHESSNGMNKYVRGLRYEPHYFTNIIEEKRNNVANNVDRVKFEGTMTKWPIKIKTLRTA